MSLAIIIPTLNAAAWLPDAVTALRSAVGPEAEIIIADGGSTDDTRQRIGDARWIQAPAGRGSQMAAAAACTDADWLLFLHVDTRLQPGWWPLVQAFMADPTHLQRAGYFQFALDDPSATARRLERMVAWRCQTFGLPYGDQGLLIAADFYRALGGYGDLPLMEDVALVRRIGRRRLVALPVQAVTAADRWQREGYWQRSARNLFCLALYGCGVPPRAIARLYG